MKKTYIQLATPTLISALLVIVGFLGGPFDLIKATLPFSVAVLYFLVENEDLIPSSIAGSLISAILLLTLWLELFVCTHYAVRAFDWIKRREHQK